LIIDSNEKETFYNLIYGIAVKQWSLQINKIEIVGVCSK